MKMLASSHGTANLWLIRNSHTSFLGQTWELKLLHLAISPLCPHHSTHLLDLSGISQELVQYVIQPNWALIKIAKVR